MNLEGVEMAIVTLQTHCSWSLPAGSRDEKIHISQLRSFLGPTVRNIKLMLHDKDCLQKFSKELKLFFHIHTSTQNRDLQIF